MDATDGDDVDAQAESAVDTVDDAAWVNRLRTGSRIRDGGDGVTTAIVHGSTTVRTVP